MSNRKTNKNQRKNTRGSNVTSRTIFTSDNLPIMRGINSAFIDLIYLDPPFNSNANYAAPIGSKAAGAEFRDTWTLQDIDVAWHGELADEQQGLHDFLLSVKRAHSASMFAYLIYMAVRLMEMHRILKPTGSIYLHCDPTAGHYLKIMMDYIFGKKNFLNEIIWAYRKWTNAATHFQKNHDVLLVYAKVKGQHTFLKQYDVDAPQNKKYEKGWDVNVVSGGIRQLIVYDKEKADKKIKTGNYDRVIYREENKKVALPDYWNIPIINSQATERIGYPTQKPIALLDRLIAASSEEGELILDPFCGCATACISAEKLGRQWIGIDVSPKAAELVKIRAEKELSDLFISGKIFKLNHRRDVPKRTDLGKITPYNAKENKNVLYGEQEGNCAGCKIHFPYRNLTIDHIIPQSKGGTDHRENLQLLCGACNSVKGPRDMSYLLAELKKRKVN